MEMTVIKENSQYSTLVLNGRLDMSGVNEIETKFKEQVAISANVVVRLQQVPFLASLAMRMLMLAAKSLHQRGGKIVLVAPQEEVENALRMAGLDSIAPLADTDEAAQKIICG